MEMKGFQQKTQGDGNFFAIKHGSIVRESKTPQEGFEKIEITDRRTGEKFTKYIQRYDTIEALVTKIEWYDTEQRFTKRYQGWKLFLNANGKRGVLDLPIQSRTTGRFMKLAENLDFTKPVEFRAWHDSKSDATAIFVGQNGESVPQKYTRDDPNGMPEPTQDFKKNWDYSKQEEFLYKRMIEVVIPKVNASQPEQPEQDEPHGEEQVEPTPATSLDEKLIERVKQALSDLSEHKDYEDRSRKELMEEFFGTSKFEEIEAMPPESVKAVLKKIDEIVIPF